ncbi:MmgE/PrpD family protein [Paracoccus pantotrophus]|uniref:MmgE/PrpD family protein n=1 Tax=Paracoccus pantotrophus TaxID=82367 RepID=UPI0009E024AF|nr:MmgE/PrpD family protein [Paracoccus pantotrophus]
MQSTSTKTSLLAEHAAKLKLSILPEEVRDRAKHVILDEVAGAYFCARSLAGGLTARYAASVGGYPEARIYATGLRVSAVNAALANGAAGHGECQSARNFDPLSAPNNDPAWSARVAGPMRCSLHTAQPDRASGVSVIPAS